MDEERKERDTDKIILAIVGMPGAGKSEVVAYLTQKGIPFVRFGDLTDEGIAALGLPLTPENERMVREKLRNEFGMAAYAIQSKPKIDAQLARHDHIAIDGLYSWEEYVFLKGKYPALILAHVYAEREVRYERLARRPVRPLTREECFTRDVAELEKLNKGGPIAMADYLLENNNDDLGTLHWQIDRLLVRLGVFASRD